MLVDTQKDLCQEDIEALEKFSMMRARMVNFKVPGVQKAAILFYIRLLLILDPVVDREVPTAATDGKVIMFNPKFWDSLSPSEQYAVCAHEALHVAFEHPLQMVNAKLDHVDWNIATDLAINFILKECGFTLPEGVLMAGEGPFSSFPVGESAMFYYHMLQQEKEDANNHSDPGSEDQDSASEDEKNNDKAESQRGKDSEEDEPEGQSTVASGEEEGVRPGSSQGGEGAGEDDQAQEGEGQGQGNNDPAKEGKGREGQGSAGSQRPVDPGKCGGVFAPKIKDEASLSEEKGKVKVAVAQALQQSSSMGTLPGGLARMVEEILNPPPDAYEVLREFINKRVKEDYSYRRLNRRYLQQGVSLPDRNSDSLGDVVVTMDCSGSINQEQLNRFASALTGIFETFKCKLTIIYHDEPVLRVQEWFPEDGPLKLTMIGGGGTSHIPCFNWIDCNYAEDAPVVVCFTDLYTQFPKQPPKLPVLWFVYGPDFPGFTRPIPPFGQVCHLKEV